MTCPTIYITDRNTAVVQGCVLEGGGLAGIALPVGEQAVEIPTAVLLAAAAALGGEHD